MYNTISSDILAQLPKGLQALMYPAQNAIENVASSGLQRRNFLKVATAGGFAMGAFPLMAQTAAPGAPAAAASSLKPTQQPSAFVQIARDGTVLVTINRLDFGQGVHRRLRR